MGSEGMEQVGGVHILQGGDVGVGECEWVFGVDVEVVGESLVAVVMCVGGQQNVDSFLFSDIELMLHLVVDEQSIGHLPSVTKEVTSMTSKP